MLLYLLYAIHIGVCLFLILVVLLQQGKGADLSVFGGGGTQAAFGARGAATVLHKATVVCFVLFIFTTLSIGLLQGRGRSSVMGGVDVSTSEEGTDTSSPLTAPAGGALPAEEGDASGEETAAEGTDAGPGDDAAEATDTEGNSAIQ